MCRPGGRGEGGSARGAARRGYATSTVKICVCTKYDVVKICSPYRKDLCAEGKDLASVVKEESCKERPEGMRHSKYEKGSYSWLIDFRITQLQAQQ